MAGNIANNVRRKRDNKCSAKSRNVSSPYMPRNRGGKIRKKEPSRITRYDECAEKKRVVCKIWIIVKKREQYDSPYSFDRRKRRPIDRCPRRMMKIRNEIGPQTLLHYLTHPPEMKQVHGAIPPIRPQHGRSDSWPTLTYGPQLKKHHEYECCEKKWMPPYTISAYAYPPYKM